MKHGQLSRHTRLYFSITMNQGLLRVSHVDIPLFTLLFFSSLVPVSQFYAVSGGWILVIAVHRSPVQEEEYLSEGPHLKPDLIYVKAERASKLSLVPQ